MCPVVRDGIPCSRSVVGWSIHSNGAVALELKGRRLRARSAGEPIVWVYFVQVVSGLPRTDDLLGRKVRLGFGNAGLGCEADTLLTCIMSLVVDIRDQRQQPTSGVGVVMGHVGWAVRPTPQGSTACLQRQSTHDDHRRRGRGG